jgi:hypothetical protein
MCRIDMTVIAKVIFEGKVFRELNDDREVVKRIVPIDAQKFDDGGNSLRGSVSQNSNLAVDCARGGMKVRLASDGESRTFGRFKMEKSFMNGGALQGGEFLHNRLAAPSESTCPNEFARIEWLPW